MDIAAMSIALNSQQVQVDASSKMMTKAKDFMEQQGEQLVEMLQASETTTPHPSLGQSIDVFV